MAQPHTMAGSKRNREKEIQPATDFINQNPPQIKKALTESTPRHNKRQIFYTLEHQPLPKHDTNHQYILQQKAKRFWEISEEADSLTPLLPLFQLPASNLYHMKFITETTSQPSKKHQQQKSPFVFLLKRDPSTPHYIPGHSINQQNQQGGGAAP
jgi:hypothetical protein